MARYLGRGQVGICQRSGKKMKRSEMVEDGQVKGLLVHPHWYEEYHPLLVPPPMRPDGMPRRRPAPPGQTAPSAPVLSGSIGTTTATLNWTASTSLGSQIQSYVVYRQVDGGSFTFMAQIPVTIVQGDTSSPEFGYPGGEFDTKFVYAQPYTDNTLSVGHTYAYVVYAQAIEGGFSSASNILSDNALLLTETGGDLLQENSGLIVL